MHSRSVVSSVCEEKDDVKVNENSSVVNDNMNKSGTECINHFHNDSASLQTEFPDDIQAYLTEEPEHGVTVGLNLFIYFGFNIAFNTLNKSYHDR